MGRKGWGGAPPAPHQPVGHREWPWHLTPHHLPLLRFHRGAL